MKNLLDRMSSTRCIVISFLLMVACGASFGYYTDAVGGRLLDETWNQQAALGVLSAMSSEQQNTHFWVTVLLDTLYPVFYGTFFIGVIWRLAGSNNSWAIWPNALGVDADFLENIVQALALAGNPDWLFLKDVLTPIKFGGLAIGLLLIIGFGIRRLFAGRQ